MQVFRVIVLLFLPAITGCVSLSSSNPSPPNNTTVVVPSDSRLVCNPGPCR
jgi:hypothetical protein